MHHGFKPQGEVILPEWSRNLVNYYWHIRVEGRNQAKRRRYYRLISKERLRLVESNISQDIVEVVCLYLSSLSPKQAARLTHKLQHPSPQLKLDFSFNN